MDIQLAPNKLAWSETKPVLFKSSAMLPAKTVGNTLRYFTDYPGGHHVTRMSNIGYTLRTSSSESDFYEKLRQHESLLRNLARTSDKLVVGLVGCPAWMSQSSNTNYVPGLGDYRDLYGYPPKNNDTWLRVMSSIRSFVESSTYDERADIYIEFWNEPDLGFWQAGLDSLLDLYALTSQVFKDTWGSKRLRVGGFGVNTFNLQMPGTLNPSAPPTLELIRHCQKNNLPLDFVSWHSFTSMLQELRITHKAIRDLAPATEQLVTEWNANADVRGGTFAPMVHVAASAILADLGVSNCVSAWEDFEADPGLRDNGYGVYRQNGLGRAIAIVHRVLNDRSKSIGFALAHPNVVAFREDSSTYRLIIFGVHDGQARLIFPSKLKAAAVTEHIWATGIPAPVLNGRTFTLKLESPDVIEVQVKL